VRVVSGLARTREVDLHAGAICPQVHRLAGELRSVIAEKYFRNSSLRADPA
jgi:hypothetical protein